MKKPWPKRARLAVLAMATGMAGVATSPALAGETPPARPAAPIAVGPEVNVSRSLFNQVETTVAIDPTNPRRLFAAAMTEATPDLAGLFLADSSDGGVTWRTRTMNKDHDGIPLLAVGDPWATFDEFGNLFFCYLNLNRSSVAVDLSTDGGVSFTPLAELAAGDQPKLVTGQGSLWLMAGGGTVQAAGARVTGLGAVEPFSPLQTAPDSAEGNFGDIAITPNGAAVISYQAPSASRDVPSFLYTHEDPDGLGPQGFGPRRLLTRTNVAGVHAIPAQPRRTIDAAPMLAVARSGPHAGRLYGTYADAPANSPNDTDVMLRHSDDRGATWSEPTRVNDDSSGRSQFWQRVAVDPTTGAVALTWYDAREDAGSGPGDTDLMPNTDVRLFGAVVPATIGAVSANFAISRSPSNQLRGDPAAGQLGSDLDYGDYAGLAFVAGRVHPVWADTSRATGDNRDGRFEMKTTAILVADVQPGPVVPESPVTVLLPIVAGLLLTGGFVRRHRLRAATSASGYFDLKKSAGSFVAQRFRARRGTGGSSPNDGSMVLARLLQQPPDLAARHGQ